MEYERSRRSVTVTGGTPSSRKRAERALREAGFRVLGGEEAPTGTVDIALAPGLLPEPARRRIRNGADDLLKNGAGDGVTALLLLNLDHFKRVRALMGADTAQLLLREIASRIQVMLDAHDRARSQRAARPAKLLHLGGDEFAVLLPDLDDEQVAARLGHDLLRAISRPYDGIAPQVYLTGRIGIALYPHDGRDFETLARHAGSVIHNEARAGRNSVRFYAAGMAAVAAERFELEAELSRAIREGELEVHYQPQFSLRTGDIVGAEALVRWHRPGIGVVPAEVFIAVAEDLGLIADLGVWVLTTAAAECRKWHDAGHRHLRISINTSAYQFRRVDMCEVVRNALHETGLDPSGLMLEVTESLVMSDVDRMVATLIELQRMGVRIALDDFGTGYSSMSYLKNFAIDCLKLDRSFVQGLPDDPGDRAVTEAIIRMAKALHLEVTAEGVETDAQRACLTALGCDYYQGFLASRPVRAADFMDLLAAHVS